MLFVRQGSKAHFFLGTPDTLSESIGSGIELVESVDDLELVERQAANGKTVTTVKDGTWHFEGVFQRADVENANKRVYPRKLWEKLIEDSSSPVQKAIQERIMVGHLEHPSDGRTDGREGAIVVTENKLLDDGTVWGKGEVLDTPNGLILQEYTRKNVPWGVSSRGSGTVDKNGVVQEDYKLKTYDAVMSPSTPGARPKVTNPEHADERDEDAAKANLAEAVALLDSDFKVLDESRQIEVTKDLLDRFGKAQADHQRGILPGEDYRPLYDRLCRMLGGGRGVTPTPMNESEEHDHATKALTALMETVVELSGRADECETLSFRVHELERQQAALAEERDAFKRELEEAKDAHGKLESKLAVAESCLRDSREDGVTSAIETMVDDQIKQHPELSGYRDVLLESDSPAEVVAAVSEVVSAGDGSGKGLTEADPLPPMFPRGKVVSESVSPPPEPGYNNDDKGVSAAAGAVKSMKNNRN